MLLCWVTQSYKDELFLDVFCSNNYAFHLQPQIRNGVRIRVVCVNQTLQRRTAILITTLIKTPQVEIGVYKTNSDSDIIARDRRLQTSYYCSVNTMLIHIYTNLHFVVTSPCGYSGKGSQRSNLPLNIKINSPLRCINN